MKIAVCDDDENQLNITTTLCEHALGDLKITMPVIIHPFCTGEKLIEAFKADKPPEYDIILMDIEFGQGRINGIEATGVLREIGVAAPVIITTSYDAYLRQGYGLGIMRYLSKPITREELGEALAACIKSINACDAKELLLKNGAESVVVRYKDILYFECFSHTVIAHTKDKKVYSVNKTIGFLEEDAPKQCFIKVNKGIIVNINGIACIKGNDLIMEDGKILSVAQRRRRQCMESLRKYIKEHM